MSTLLLSSYANIELRNNSYDRHQSVRSLWGEDCSYTMIWNASYELMYGCL